MYTYIYIENVQDAQRRAVADHLLREPAWGQVERQREGLHQLRGEGLHCLVDCGVVGLGFGSLVDTYVRLDARISQAHKTPHTQHTHICIYNHFPLTW